MKILLLSVLMSMTSFTYAHTKDKPMKALIVVTSHSQMGNTGKPTGYYLPEVSHPFFKLLDLGITVDIASPKGGKAPMDENSRDLKDPANRRFLEGYASKLDHTLKLSAVNADDYQAIIFAGGHGTMWDFAQTPSVASVAEKIYAKGGIVSAVCHGPAALINLKDENGDPLVKGKKIAAFTNDEEEAAGLTQTMPFLLETELVKQGAIFEKAPLWQKKVVVSGRLVTGQNPASAEGVGEEVAKLIKSLH